MKIIYSFSDVQSLVLGRDNKEYGTIGFPKGTIHEGYSVTIPHHASVQDNENENLWHLEVPSKFTFHLTKVVMGFDENNQKKLVNEKIVLSPQEFANEYNQYRDDYIDGKRLTVNSDDIKNLEIEVEQFFEEITRKRGEFTDEEKHEKGRPLVEKITKMFTPKPREQINMRYFYDLREGIKSLDSHQSVESVALMKNQQSMKWLNQHAYSLLKLTKDPEKKVKMNELYEETKMLNEPHKLPSKKL